MCCRRDASGGVHSIHQLIVSRSTPTLCCVALLIHMSYKHTVVIARIEKDVGGTAVGRKDGREWIRRTRPDCASLETPR